MGPGAVALVRVPAGAGSGYLSTGRNEGGEENMGAIVFYHLSGPFPNFTCHSPHASFSGEYMIALFSLPSDSKILG